MWASTDRAIEYDPRQLNILKLQIRNFRKKSRVNSFVCCVETVSVDVAFL